MGVNPKANVHKHNHVPINPNILEGENVEQKKIIKVSNLHVVDTYTHYYTNYYIFMGQRHEEKVDITATQINSITLSPHLLATLSLPTKLKSL